VLVEGLLVAAIGSALAAPLGLLVGRALSDAVGNLFLGARSPMRIRRPGYCCGSGWRSCSRSSPAHSPLGVRCD